MEAVKNKKAFYDYFFEDNYECGIVLEGCEVKPILNRQINLDASHVIYQDGALFLLHKKEIARLMGQVQQKGYTLIVTSVYTKKNKIKCNLALAKGKNQYDKRQTIKERESKINAQAIMKHDLRNVKT
jgi:SsrA-binding protein